MRPCNGTRSNKSAYRDSMGSVTRIGRSIAAAKTPLPSLPASTKLAAVREICFYHAGCPDGFGAAWAAWRSRGGDARYIARRHEHTIQPEDYMGDWVIYLDIAPGMIQ